MNQVDIHREALKERGKLPTPVGAELGAVEEVILHDNVYAPGLALKREQEWGKQAMLVAQTTFQGTTYCMAWEVGGGAAFIWAYGPHEGFYGRLRRRARQ